MTQDFPQCWSAARFALQGQPELVYDLKKLEEDSRSVFSPNFIGHAWLYPPPAMLMYLPFGTLPYWPSWLLFSTLTALALLTVLRKIVPLQVTLWAMLASPVFELNYWMGQNGALNAALIGIALLCFYTRPIVVGLCVGAMIYKPHIAPVLGLLLVVERRWLSLLVAALTSALLVVASTYLFGVKMWEAWFTSLNIKDLNFSNGVVYFEKMDSVLGFAKHYDLHSGAAWTLHLLAMLPAVYMTVATWKKPHVPFEIKAAMACFATLLVAPYAYMYDYVITLMGMAFWVKHLLQTPWNLSSYKHVVLLWLYPLWHSMRDTFPVLPLSPLLLLYLLFYLYRSEVRPLKS